MIRRLGIYLHEMFPITAFAGTILMSFAVQLAIGRLSGYMPYFHLSMLLSGIAISCVSLLIRVMDEFKDYDDDLKNFPERPLPSGRVLVLDLKVLGWSCVVIVLGLSFYIDQKALFVWSLIILTFTFLMLKWFFLEKLIRNSLPLAFFSHHPVVFLNFIYILIASLAAYPTIEQGVAIYLLPLCFIFTNWEVSRKIRAPQDETAYTTYSKILGPRKAIGISILLQVTYVAAMAVIFTFLKSPFYLSIPFYVAMLYLIYPSLKFAWKLELKKPLKDYAEGQILTVMLFLLVASIL